MSYRRYRSAWRGRRAAAVLALVVVGLVVAAAAAPAGEEPSPLVAAHGVTVAGTPVGGLTAMEARAAVEDAFARPLVVRYGGRSWQRTPEELGARTDPDTAVRAALAARPGTTVSLEVSQSRSAARSWAEAIAESLDREARSSRIILRGARPFVTRSQTGLRLRQPPRHALDGHRRLRGRHPRDARRGLDRLLGLPRVHPYADRGRRVALRACRSRHAGLHRRGLSSRPLRQWPACGSAWPSGSRTTRRARAAHARARGGALRRGAG